MANLQLLLLGLLVAVPLCWSACDVPHCEPHCGFTVGASGCAECDCSKSPTDESCSAICPADCGQVRQDTGCLECQCGGTWFNVETPPPPPGHDHH